MQKQTNKPVVALTGGIASGKSTVATLFSDLGAEVIDADLIAHALVQPSSPTLDKIIQYFDADLLHTDRSLNRRKLRDIIIKNADARKWLEELLHPIIIDEINRRVKMSQAPYSRGCS